MEMAYKPVTFGFGDRGGRWAPASVDCRFGYLSVAKVYPSPRLLCCASCERYMAPKAIWLRLRLVRLMPVNDRLVPL